MDSVEDLVQTVYRGVYLVLWINSNLLKKYQLQTREEKKKLKYLRWTQKTPKTQKKTKNVNNSSIKIEHGTALHVHNSIIFFFCSYNIPHFWFFNIPHFIFYIFGVFFGVFFWIFWGLFHSKS